MIRSMISAFFRHLLSLIAGIDVGTAIVDSAPTDAYSGFAIALAALVWSLIEKSKTVKPLQPHYN